VDLSTSRKAAALLSRKISLAESEEFWVLALDPMCRLIEARMIFKGTVDFCFIHPRDIFRFAVQVNATSILCAHNHPSGACYPSPADEELTERLKVAADLMQIALVDHIIVVPGGHFFSFAEKKWKEPQLTGGWYLRVGVGRPQGS